MNKEKIKESFFYFFKIGRSQQILLGVFLILFSIILFASMISYFNTWKVDQSELDSFFELNSESKNIARKFGSIISHFLIYKMFGIASFIFSFLFFISGVTFFVGAKSKKLIDKWFWGLYMMIWISIFTSFNFSDKLYGGSIGLEVIDVITVYIGEIGIISMLIFGLIYFLVIFFKIRPENIYNFLKKYFISLKQKSKLNVDQKLNSDDFV